MRCCKSAPRYIGARTARYELDEVDHMVSLQIGVGFPIQKRQEAGLENWELLALRLLAGPARIKMISALRERPMTTREMARELGFAPGHSRPGCEQFAGCPPAVG